MKIRINDLARELEVKSKAILDVLLKVGVTEKKTHSSSIEVDEAERVKAYFAGQHRKEWVWQFAEERCGDRRIQAEDRPIQDLEAR